MTGCPLGEGSIPSFHERGLWRFRADPNDVSYSMTMLPAKVIEVHDLDSIMYLSTPTCREDVNRGLVGIL
jgi:hypothetical protein